MMTSGVCSCGEIVEMNGLDPTGVARLLASVRAARLGILSGEISAAEGLDQIESALNEAVHRTGEKTVEERLKWLVSSSDSSTLCSLTV